MLPTYNTRRTFSNSQYAPGPLARLKARSRVTNLAVVIICSIASVSLALNVYVLLFRSSSAYYDYDSAPSTPLSFSRDVSSAVDQSIRELSHLIVVPGHGIWKGSCTSSARGEGLIGPEGKVVMDAEEWLVGPEVPSNKSANVEAYYQHIVRG